MYRFENRSPATFGNDYLQNRRSETSDASSSEAYACELLPEMRLVGSPSAAAGSSAGFFSIGFSSIVFLAGSSMVASYFLMAALHPLMCLSDVDWSAVISANALSTALSSWEGMCSESSRDRLVDARNSERPQTAL